MVETITVATAASTPSPLPEVRFAGAEAFHALRCAETFLAVAGFSIAPGSAGDPTPIMFGDYIVAKWKNLTTRERVGVHGLIEGNRRDGPLTIRLTERCPVEGVESLTKTAAELAD